MINEKSDSGQDSDQEIIRRREIALKRMLNTPPTKHGPTQAKPKAKRGRPKAKKESTI